MADAKVDYETLKLVKDELNKINDEFVDEYNSLNNDIKDLEDVDAFFENYTNLSFSEDMASLFNIGFDIRTNSNNIVSGIDATKKAFTTSAADSTRYLLETYKNPFGNSSYTPSSSYGNSSSSTTSPTPKDTDDDTGADKSKDGTTSPYTQNPGNGDTAAHPTDDGTSKDPKVDEEEQKRKEEEQKRQEEEKKRKEEEQKRQEEEKKRQEEEQKRQEEERRRQEEEQKRKEDNSNTGSEVAIPTGPSSSDNNNRTPERVTVPNTETTDNPVAAGIETSKPETTTTTESASTSVVGETKDLFKNKKTPDSKTGTGTTLPKSESTKTTSTTSSSDKGFNAVPIAVGLGAAVAGGVGLKAYKDHKENAKFDDENEDSFSNGNRFWSEEDPNVINSEETAVSGDELFAEQTTSPSYSAMANDANQDDGGWSLDESSTQPEEAFDLLGDN